MYFLNPLNQFYNIVAITEIRKWSGFYMRLKIIVLALLLITLLAACNGKDTEDNNSSKDNVPKDIKELVHDYSVGSIENQTASITSKQLIVTDSNKDELTYGLPEDEFFVSIAPFINETHPCTIHSLTGCQGELVDEDFDIYIEDMEGNIILDETMNSGTSGFIDLWLPREKTYSVKEIGRASCRERV